MENHFFSTTLMAFLKWKIIQTSNILTGLLLTIVISGCGFFQPTKVISPIDSDGCPRPVELITLNPIDVELTSLNIGNFALAKFKAGSQPTVFQALEKVASEPLVHEYLICKAEKAIEKDGKKVTFAHREYIRSKLQFASTKPTADQYNTWETIHPLPTD